MKGGGVDVELLQLYWDALNYEKAVVFKMMHLENMLLFSCVTLF